jgi:ATP-dependent helicase/nuclease subunit A
VLTESQQICLRERGNVIVVAGAGTGKTSTLVERCVHLLLHDKCSLEEILMVTFTDAAAAEMRDRIRRRLLELLQDASLDSSDHIQRQLSLLDTAAISTLHSFCLRLIREHFHGLGISPAVLVLDEKQSGPLVSQTFDALFAEYYEGDTPKARAVQELISTVGRDSEETLRRLVRKIYSYAQSLEEPEGWLDRQLALYEQAEPKAWSEWLAQGVEAWRRRWIGELAGEGAVPAVAQIVKCLEGNDLATIKPILEENAGWNKTKSAWRKRFQSFVTDVEYLGSLSPEALRQDWDWARPGMVALLRLVREFTARFAQAKHELAGVDFADLEQLALKALREPAIARSVSERFRYIFVDEFQDINPAQDAILRMLSRGENRFLVGDVKQSIYRFRRANPKIFGQYEERWRDETGSRRVPLSDNFRSREGLLAVINSVFACLMRPVLGGVTYEEDVHLRFGNPSERQPLARSARSGPCVELHMVDEVNEEDNGEGSEVLDLLVVEREARLAALCLQNLKQRQHAIWDAAQKCFRPAEWRDMAILMRSPASRVEAFAKEFHRQGIPLAAARSGFFECLEVADLVNALKLLDNPLQDIPLLAVLHSPLVAMSLDELAEIRGASHRKPFWFALKDFHAQQRGDASQKSETFLRQFGRWRTLARQTSLSVCLERILADTHYESLLLAEARGEERLANVRRLLDLVREYDPWQRQGLYRFLRFLEAQEEAEVEQEPASAQTEDAVRLLSIHKSKGLEFPVVLLAGLGTVFNNQDLRDDILIHETYGVCPKVKPPRCVQSYPSAAYWLARQSEQRELLGEELRLLYVAMTRARDTLLLVGSAKNPSWREEASTPLTDQDLIRARSFWQWLKQWLARATAPGDWASDMDGGNALLRWSLYSAADPRLKVLEREERKAPECESLNPAEALQLQRRIHFKYPHAAATREPAIKRISEIIWDSPAPSDGAQLLLAPFAQKGRSQSRGKRNARKASSRFTAAQIGDATHLLLENLELDEVGSLAQLRQAAEAMIQDGILTKQEIAAINLEGIAAFWSGEIGQRILANTQNVHRELPFTMRLSPEDLQRLGIGASAGELKGERFVGRGKVDLAVILPKEIWILDFKTDRVDEADLPAKVAPYSKQLKLYGLALSRIYRRPVTALWLHFLALEKTVAIED